MIPTKEKDIIVESTFDSEDIRMTIDVDATEHLIGLLTDLYSNPTLAVIREISCNAYDSHREARQTRPIEVTLPTRLNPIFQVQDWGVGLNADDFRNLYSKYGKSTKRETNDQIGSLGLGCKAPLTFTNQFMVTGIKNGIKSEAIIMLDENNMPVLKIVDELPTDDPNGVTVIVPVSDHYDKFADEAEVFFKFWEANSVIINGQSIGGLESLIDFPIDEHTFIYKDSDYLTQNRAYVVMGNISYCIDTHKVNQWFHLNGYGIVYRIPMGDVHFTPNRENLHYTDKTIKYLIKITKDGLLNFPSAFAKFIGLCDTPAEAYEIMRKYKNLFNNIRIDDVVMIKYRGQNVPDQIIPDVNNVDDRWIITPGKSNLRRSSLAKILTGSMDQYLIVDGFDRGYSETVKRKLWQYLSDNNIDFPINFAFTKKLNNPWIKFDRIVQWNDVKDIKLNLTNGSASHRSGKITVPIYHNGSKENIPLYEIPGEDLILYSSILDCEYFEIAPYFDNHYLAIIDGRNLSKVCRIYPLAVDYWSYRYQVGDDYIKSLDDDMKLLYLLKNTYSFTRFMSWINYQDILDPEILYWGSLWNNTALNLRLNDMPQAFISNIVAARNIGGNIDNDRVKNTVQSWHDRYPLLFSSRHSDINQDHATIYVNAVYEKRVKE